jgi:RNA polymerase sigma factor (sigma-70 family)
VSLTTRTSVPGTAAGGDESPCQPAFVTTQWSVVLAAGRAETVQAQAALETLCRAYWYPLYAYVRRRGYSPEDAQDLTQEFFARLLERHRLGAADPQRGRFRSFLLTSMKNFLADEWDKARTRKRGGGLPTVPWPVETAESRYGAESVDSFSPERAFEYHWAMTLLEDVVTRLRAEYERAGKAELFTALNPCLVGERAAQPYAELARELGLSEGAVKSAVHRLRQRYRQLLRGQIAHTVTSSDEVDDELSYMFTILGR